MKKNVLTSLCLIIISHLSIAQNIVWSKKIYQTDVCVDKGLMTDKNAIVYSYGSRNLDNNQNPAIPPLTDTSGSFLQSYSTNGALLFSKRWAIPFYIQKMEYDGDQYFYFAATFLGVQVIDGITIISKGNMDGVTGKMDLTGHIIWMKTFGGSGADRGNGVCFNATDNSVYVTGNIQDTLFLNNSFQSINQQSAIIVNYSSAGTLVNYKLYDFVLKRNLGFINSGREICKDPSGNFFLLMDRDGHDWNGPDTVTGSIMGRYIIKLNPSLDTIWSTYIVGPASYYGWNCKSLRASANGDVYIAWESHGKYGGDAYLSRLNGSTGQISWNYHNIDGLYTDLFIDVNTVFLIGNEGANGCPCPNNNGGYYVIKKIDASNSLLGETRFSGVGLKSITKDVSGNLFTTGNYSTTAIIGPDTLIGGSGNFLTKLSDINCNPPIISVSTSSYYGQYYPLCQGASATLTKNLTSGTFKWSTGSTATQINVNSTGLYSVMNAQPNGCKAYSLPVDIEALDNTVSQTGNTLTANEPNIYYQWIDCGNNDALISGATNQSFTPSVSGSYAVIVNNNNCSDTSACNNIVTTGIVNNSEADNFSVFPNPTNSTIYINYKSSEMNSGFQIYIKNILGQTVYSYAISSFQGEYKKAIDLSKEEPGNYYVQIITERKTVGKKITVYK